MNSKASLLVTGAIIGATSILAFTQPRLFTDGAQAASHEMGFARQVANRVIFMNSGQIVEQNEPEKFFMHPQHERTKLFLSQIPY
jgi:hypothetical protein